MKILKNLTRIAPRVSSQVDSRCLCTSSLFEKRLQISNNLIKYQKSNAADRLEILSSPSSIPVSLVFFSLSYLKGSLELAMSIRRDVLQLTHNHSSRSNNMIHGTVEETAHVLEKEIINWDKEETLSITRRYWHEMDSEVKRWLLASFSSEMLYIQQVSFDTSSGIILEKIARGESVHSVRTLSELKKRLNDGRRCYALFHHRLPQEPLVFVHVAFTTELAASLKEISGAHEASSPGCAIFYSVNSLHKSLGGLDLASRLIRGVADEIQLSRPTINYYSTLSPVPGFRNWLLLLQKVFKIVVK